MRITMQSASPKFTPVTLTIHLETVRDLILLREIAGGDLRIPYILDEQQTQALPWETFELKTALARDIATFIQNLSRTLSDLPSTHEVIYNR